MKARHNPFRTSRLHALSYHFPPGDSMEHFLSRLQLAGYRGAIVGPHGAGKTTLMLQLGRALRAGGRQTVELRFTESSPTLSWRSWLQVLRRCGNSLLLLDGLDHVSAPLRRVICSRVPYVIATAHNATRLPTLLNCATSEALVDALLERLDIADERSRRAAYELLKRYDGDVRLTFRALYDLFAEDRLRATGGCPSPVR